jgi:hypothetical protein
MAPSFSRSVKFVCILIFNIFIAVLGTAALEAEIGSVVHPRSIAGLLWKWWGLDFILCRSDRLPRVEKMEGESVNVDVGCSGGLVRVQISLCFDGA